MTCGPLEHAPRFLKEWQTVTAALPSAARDRLAEFRLRVDRPLVKIVDLVDFLSVEEVDELARLLSQAKSSPASEEGLRGYDRHKARNARRQREQTRSGQEIGPLPPIQNPAEREACRYNFRRWLLRYCPEPFELAFGENHEELIRKIQDCVLRGEIMAIAMPRGSGKTTLCELACLWAILYGHSRFTLLVHANEEKAAEALSHIKEELETNDRLLADFPEACYPIRKLGGRANLAKGQLLDGLPTRMEWGKGGSEIRLPSVAGSDSDGAVIVSEGVFSAVRGANKRHHSGQRMRPDLMLIDDPQTDQSARSREECAARLRVITKGLMGCFGPNKKRAGLVPCTVLEKGDVADTLLNRELNPKFNGVRYKALYGKTERLDLWLQYWDLFKESEKAGKPPEEADQFYLDNQVEMDAGMQAGWLARTEGRLTAIQHCMEVWLEDAEYFFKEMQNEPQEAAQVDETFLRCEDIAKKVNNYARRELPQYVTHITAHIDIQKRVLFYMVIGWGDDFTGQILEYGTWPDQRLTHFTARHVQPSMQEALNSLGYNDTSLELQIYRGLDHLTRQLAALRYTRTDGTVKGINLIGIDANNWRETVVRFASESPLLQMLLPMHGEFIGPNETQIREYTQKPGEVIGEDWIRKAKGGTEYARFDGNYWKTFVARRLATPHPSPGALTIYGPEGTRHSLLGRHLDSEIREPLWGRRQMDEWKPRPGETENHWWDNAVGCAVLASMRGCRLTVSVAKAPQARPQLEVSFGNWPTLSG